MTCSRRRHGDDGQIIVIFALSMALFMFLLIAFVADVAVEFAAAANVQAAAQDAAVSGANDVSPSFLYTGAPPVLNGAGGPAYPGIPTYKTACEESGDRSVGITSTSSSNQTICSLNNDSNGNPVCVHAVVVRTVNLPIVLLGASATVRGSFDAAPVVGTTVPTNVSYTPGTCPVVP